MERLSYIQMILLTGILLMNIYTFYLFFVDKRRARKNKHRISEKQLLLSSLAVGGIGALLGMSKFRHKTKKIVFKIGVPVTAVWTGIIVVGVLFYL